MCINYVQKRITRKTAEAANVVEPLALDTDNDNDL